MISATDIASMTRCRHRVYLDRFGDPKECVPNPEFVQILWKNGRLHEADVLEGLDAKVIDAGDPEVRAAETLALMQRGVSLIYHGRLTSGTMAGEPDLLQRVERPSRLGDYSYAPADIKLGLAYENDRPKPHYVAQLCAYAELLEAVQGVRPWSGWIIDRDNDWVPVNLNDHWRAYEAWRNEARAIADGSGNTVAARKAECSDCVWINHCDRDLHARDDVTLVKNIGEAKREKLWELGIRSVAQLAQTRPAHLASIKGIGLKSAENWRRDAEALKRGTAEILGRWDPPHVDFEVSYDVEDFLFDRTVYLHGLLLRARGGSFDLYEGICAVAGEAERSVWRRFLDRVEQIDSRGEYRVYVYSHHEETQLDALIERHGGSAALSRFRDRFVDLHEVVQKTVVFPTESDSLKEVAAFCGFSWRDSDPGGKQSIAWWANYLADPAANAALRERVLRYNEDDVRASFAIRDWIARVTASRA